MRFISRNVSWWYRPSLRTEQAFILGEPALRKYYTAYDWPLGAQDSEHQPCDVRFHCTGTARSRGASCQVRLGGIDPNLHQMHPKSPPSKIGFTWFLEVWTSADCRPQPSTYTPQSPYKQPCGVHPLFGT